MSRMVKVPTVRMAKIARSRGSIIGPASVFRLVYKCKTSKYVFKFLRGDTNRSRRTANAREYAVYTILKETVTLPDGVKLPEMYLLADGTLAAEYIDGYHPNESTCDGYGHSRKKCPGLDSCWATKVLEVGLRDIHHQNVLITDDGTVYIIDLDGGFRDKANNDLLDEMVGC
jgi:predicted Ser/Thr protein kinase